MNLLKSKLRSQNGASMIITMVFLLFCMFIGGSVFTAATANAGRISHESDQQQYLSQRSAALLLLEDLRGTQTNPLRLSVYQSKKTVQEIQVMADGSIMNTIEPPFQVNKTRFIVSNSIIESPMQRMLYESAILCYMKKNAIDYADVEINGIRYKNGASESSINNITQFWNYDPNIISNTNTIAVKGTATPIGGAHKDFTNFNATFVCQDGSKGSDTLYDFDVGFDQNNQLKIHMDSYHGTSDDFRTSQIARFPKPDGTFIDARIETELSRTVISWTVPAITKGGA